MKRQIRTAMAVGAAALLAACVQGRGLTVDHTYVAGWQPTTINYIAKKGGLPAIIVGTPFPGASMEVVERTVLSSIERGHFGQSFPVFNERDKPQGHTGAYRMVVVLNAAPTASGARACIDADQPTLGEAHGRLRVLLALCAGPDRITSAAGSASGVGGPSDPAFANLVAQLTNLSMPPRDPEQPGGAAGQDWDD